MRTLVPAIALAALSLQAHADDTGMHRIRLTETSVTEQGRITGAPDVKLQTKGYGFTYIAKVGVGVTYTALQTYSVDDAIDLEVDHSYLDVGYTYGNAIIVTAGAGMGSGDDVESARSLWIGPGFSIYGLELYWIRRANWVSLKDDGGTLASLHWQLGIGYHF